MNEPKLSHNERTAFEQASFLVRQLESIVSSLGHLKDQGVLIYDCLYHRLLLFPETSYTLRDSALDLQFLIKEVDRLFYLLRKVLGDERLSSDRRLALYDHLRELSSSYHVIVPETAHFNPFELFKGHLAIKLSKMDIGDQLEQITRQFEKPHVEERFRAWEERGKAVTRKEELFRILQIVGTVKVPGLIDLLHEKIDEGFRSLDAKGGKALADPFYGYEVLELVTHEVHESFFRRPEEKQECCETLIKNLGEEEWRAHGRVAFQHFIKLQIELFYVRISREESTPSRTFPKILPGDFLFKNQLIPWLQESAKREFPSLTLSDQEAIRILDEVNALREKTWEHAKRYERA